MRQLRDDTHLILDGEVRVYRRERSKRWQAAFVIDGHTIRISTGKKEISAKTLHAWRSHARGKGQLLLNADTRPANKTARMS